MRTYKENLAHDVLTLAVRAALAAMFALPLAVHAGDGDDEAAALKRPVSVVELGVLNVSKDSAKFGEYNGLNKANAYAVGNIDLRGGDGYGGGDGLTRWSLSGSDLGTSARELGASMAKQGRWNVGLRVDELTHNISDSYQTPFLGALGDNNFVLPAGFGIINTTALTGKNNPLVGTRNMTPGQLSSFRTEDIGSSRTKSTLAAGFTLNEQWSTQFEYSRLKQNGAKLINGSSSDARTGAGAAGTWAKEAMVTLMNPTNYTTDNFSAGLNWVGDKGFASATYLGSLFTDGYDSLSWQSPMGTGSATTGATTTTLAGGYQQNMLSTAPSNVFHQMNLTGGYALSSSTRLVGGLSYGRNTQNNGYLVDLMQTGGLPKSSLDALVVTTHANLKLTNSSVKDLALSAGLKYNERDNRTASDVYRMFDIGGGPAAAANSGTRRTEINAPYSLRRSEFEAAADYRLTKQQNLRLAYGYEDVKRWCNNMAGAGAPDPAVVGVIAGNAASPAGANCVIVPASKENKLSLNYRLRASDDVDFNAAYVYAKRTATIDNNALTPLNDQAGANGTGIVNASNYKGYLEFFDAGRAEDLFKAGVNWQLGERFNLGLNGRHTVDRYVDSTLGVQRGTSSSVNLDAAFNYSDNGVLAAYVSNQQRARSMLSGASGLGATDNATSYAALVAPTNIWANSLSDRDQTFGINARHKGLMGGKLELTGDVSMSVGKTSYHTDVPYYVPTATAPTCDALTSLSCGDTPTITSRNLTVKLAGYYQLNKQGKIALGYHFQRQRSNDYYYNVYQVGYSSSTLLPTNQTAPNYTINVVSATYVYTF